MITQKIVEILEKEGFTQYTEELDEDFRSIMYNKKEDYWAELTYYTSSGELFQIAISNSRYAFNSDFSGRDTGIVIGKGTETPIDIEIFKYLLEIQKDPELHLEKACRIYLEFMKWERTELSPVLETLDMMMDTDIEDLDNENYSLQLPMYFSFRKKDDKFKRFSIYFDSLTFEPGTTLKTDIYKLESYFIYEALIDEGFAI